MFILIFSLTALNAYDLPRPPSSPTGTSPNTTNVTNNSNLNPNSGGSIPPDYDFSANPNNNNPQGIIDNASDSSGGMSMGLKISIGILILVIILLIIYFIFAGNN